MKFNEYLKSCRKTYKLTQEELVQELYNFDESFIGVDTRTLTRWEQAQTQPSIDRQMTIVKYFQTLSSSVFPCFEEYDTEEVQAQICRVGISNIIGKNRELVLNFPASYIIVDDLKITHLRHSDTIDSTIKIAMRLDKEFTESYSQLQDKNFKDWAMHPSTLFLICEVDKQFFGLLFTLRLKPEIFDKIMNFEMQEKDLDVSHFASYDEDGCSYLLNFFAHSPKAASLLYLRYYAHLIANQDSISKVGALTMMSEGKKLIERIKLSHKESAVIYGHSIYSYEAPLSDVLINEAVLKMIFQKQDCPQDDN